MDERTKQIWHKTLDADFNVEYCNLLLTRLRLLRAACLVMLAALVIAACVTLVVFNVKEPMAALLFLVFPWALWRMRPLLDGDVLAEEPTLIERVRANKYLWEELLFDYQALDREIARGLSAEMAELELKRILAKERKVVLTDHRLLHFAWLKRLASDNVDRRHGIER